VTVAHPAALALLALPAVLLWLRLRARRPREAEASSLLVWRRVVPGTAGPDRPKPPLAAWVEAAGAAALALAIADPSVAGAPMAEPHVLLDTSASMHVRRPDGTTRLEAARAAVHRAGVRPHLSGEVAQDLPAYLSGDRPVVVLTDRPVPGFPDDPPRLRVIALGGPVFNAGITAIAAEPIGEQRFRVLVTVEAHGAAGPVEGWLQVDGASRSITVLPGVPASAIYEIAVREAPLDADALFEGRFEWAAIEATVSFPGDALPDDDSVTLRPAGGCRVGLVRGEDAGLDAMARAMEAAGAVRRRGFLDPASLVHLGAPGFRDLEIYIPAAAPGPEVAGASVVASDHPLARDVHVDPSVTLGPRGTSVPRGVPVLSDDAGALVAVRDRDGYSMGDIIVEFGFRPGGSWVERDPSFVVLAQNLVEMAAEGPLRLEAEGVLDPAETDAAGSAFGDADAALAAAFARGGGPGPSLAPALLAAAAALLAAAWLLAR